MKEWVKLHTEAVNDPKLGTLGWANIGIWWTLNGLAGLIDDRDDEGKETGKLDSLENIAWALRCDLPTLQGALDSFAARRMMRMDDGGIWWVCNYPKRQARPPSDRLAAERQRKHRAREQEASREGNEDGSSGGGRDCHAEAEAEAEADADPETDAATAAEADRAVAAAGALGIDQTTASELIDGYGARLLAAQVEYVKAQVGIGNPAGLVITRLRNGLDPPPRVDPDEADRLRYITGPYAQFVEH